MLLKLIVKLVIWTRQNNILMKFVIVPVCLIMNIQTRQNY